MNRRVNEGCQYWFIGALGVVSSGLDYRGSSSNRDFKSGNYYKTKEEALLASRNKVDKFLEQRWIAIN